MSRKQQIEAQFREAQRQYAAGELPLPDENDPTESWPLDKYSVWLFNAPEDGPLLLEVFLEHRGIIKYEALIDAAAELERRCFPHVAEILRKVAENAPSQLDDIISDERRRWLMGRWLRGRVRITGQSWNELVRFYGLDKSGWMSLRARDLICENGYWREIDGADTVH
jgi:hypothetical protein